MRVFVVGTGRCGSVSFAEACKFITNYTVGHETPQPLTARYPDNHIEVNTQLRSNVYVLSQQYPKAKFVHLIRDPGQCIDSLAALDGGEVMEAYRRLYPSLLPSEDPRDIAGVYYWSEFNLIENQLYPLPSNYTRRINLGTVKSQWLSFWDWIGALGDFSKSLASWDTPHNTREDRGENR